MEFNMKYISNLSHWVWIYMWTGIVNYLFPGERSIYSPWPHWTILLCNCRKDRGEGTNKNISAGCYRVDSLISTKELQHLGNTDGKQLLPMCWNCFDDGLPLVISSNSRTSQKKLNHQRMTRGKRIDAEVTEE